MSSTSPEGSSDCPEQKNGTWSRSPSPSMSACGAGTCARLPDLGFQIQTSVTFSRKPVIGSAGARPQNMTSPVGITTAFSANVGNGIVCVSHRPTWSAGSSAAAIRVASAAACRDACRSSRLRSAAGLANHSRSASRWSSCSRAWSAPSAAASASNNACSRGPTPPGCAQAAAGSPAKAITATIATHIRASVAIQEST